LRRKPSDAPTPTPSMGKLSESGSRNASWGECIRFDVDKLATKGASRTICFLDVVCLSDPLLQPTVYDSFPWFIMAPKHELVKGPLRPPKPNPLKVSYTQPPASKDEVSVKTRSKEKIPGASESC
jgi:hypothetical protein